jgi:hypothetical protein
MRRLLVALYPRAWRDTFGDEFAALLDQTRLTPVVIVDVVIHATRLRAKSHRRVLLVAASASWSAGFEYGSVHAGLTANILWAPTDPERALALFATVGPWLALALATIIRRQGDGHHRAAKSSASS